MTAKPITLRARWRGTDPEPGQYLKAPRGRTAYLIAEVARTKGTPMLGRHHLRIKVWRTAPSELPPNAIVHDWRWDKRLPASSARRAA